MRAELFESRISALNENLATFQSRGWVEMAKVPADTGLKYILLSCDDDAFQILR